MARFDVYRYSSRTAPLVLDVQANVLSGFGTRVVIPLAPASKAGKEELARLKPRLSIDGKDYILMTADIATLPSNRLGVHVVNVENRYRDEITNALDFLFYGF